MFTPTRTMLLSLLASLCLMSCEKVDIDAILNGGQTADNSTTGFVQTFHVNMMTITGFDDPVSRAVVPVSQFASVINLAIFQDGVKQRSVTQKVGDANFGTLTLNLEAGEYDIVCIAHSCSGNATITSPDKIAFPNNKVTDTFSFHQTITVTGSADHDLSLKRMVAMFRLNLLGTIPENVKQLKFYYTGGSSTLDATTGFGCVNSKQTELRTVESHAAGQTFEVYTFPHDETGYLAMTISALDADGVAFLERKFENVPVQKNAITTYSGMLFTDQADASSHTFTFFGDNAWSEGSTITF